MPPEPASPSAPAASAAPAPSRRLLVVWISALAALAAFAALAPLVVALTPAPPPVEEVLRELVVATEHLRPEPAESRLLVVGALLALAFPILWFALLLPRLERAVERRPRALAAGAAALTGALALAALVGDDLHFLRRLSYFERPATLLAGAALALPALLPWRSRGARAAGRVLLALPPAFLFALTLAGGLFVRDDPYPRFPLGGHFEATFFSVVQVFEGRPLLTEAANQYGLYAHFLAPVFRVIGLDVPRYSAVMTLLAAAFVALLLFVSLRLARERWLGVALWAAGVGASFYFGRAWHRERLAESLGYAFHDPYFQYNPVRTLFPGLCLALALLVLASGRRREAWAGRLVAAAGVLWNFDSGLVAWLAFTAFLAYRRLEARRSLAGALRGVGLEAALAAGTLALVGAAFTGAVAAAYGQAPRWSLFLDFQRVFYGSGYFMLPMPLPGAWMLVVLVYALALAYAVHALFRPAPEGAPSPAFALLLAVLGLGLFSYYQGRSHPDVLLAGSYPAWLLGAMFLGAARERLRAPAARAALVFALAAPFLAAVVIAPGVAEEVRDRLGYLSQPAHPMDGDFEFVRRETGPGTPLVLAGIASVYYLEAGRAPAFAPSMPELVQRKDVDRLVALLRGDGPHVVFLDREFLQVLDRVWGRAHPLRRALEGFRVAATSPSGMVLRLERPPSR